MFGILNALKEAFVWLLNLIAEPVTAVGMFLFNSAIEGIGTAWQVDTAFLHDSFGIANAWVPLDFGLGLLSTFYGFRASFLVFKFIVRFIPFIG